MTWKVPLFDLNYGPEEEAAVLEVLRSRWLTAGPQTSRFEVLFSEYLGSSVRSVALSNCTAALHLALLAGGIGEGDEVIISGLSFVACLNVVTLVGARPVLADCKSFHDWNVSVEDIRKKITPRTKALMIVHFAGYPFDVDEIMKLCRKHQLLVIEDVAHAIGAEYKGMKCGTLGDIGCFSFFSNKNLSTGEGGMLTTRSQKIFDAVKLLRSHGMTSMTIERHEQRAISYDVGRPGLNYRFDEIRASLGIQQLAKLQQGNIQRGLHVERYRVLLKEVGGVIIPWSQRLEDRMSSYHIFPVLLPAGANRSVVIARMMQDGVQASQHYPAYQSFLYYKDLHQAVPVADEISSRVLTLPLYPSMKEEQIVLVVRSLRQALNA